MQKCKEYAVKISITHSVPSSLAPPPLTTNVLQILGYFPMIVYIHQQWCSLDFKVLVSPIAV